MQALGMPITPKKTVKSILSDIMSHQGFFVEGPSSAVFSSCGDKIVEMIEASKQAAAGMATSVSNNVHCGSTADNATIQVLTSDIDNLTLKADRLESENGTLRENVFALRRELEELLSSQGNVAPIVHVISVKSEEGTGATGDEGDSLTNKLSLHPSQNLPLLISPIIPSTEHRPSSISPRTSHISNVSAMDATTK